MASAKKTTKNKPDAVVPVVPEVVPVVTKQQPVQQHKYEEDVSLDHDPDESPPHSKPGQSNFTRLESISDIRQPFSTPAVPPLRIPLRNMLGEFGKSTTTTTSAQQQPETTEFADDDIVMDGHIGAEEKNNNNSAEGGVGDYDYMAYFEHYSKEENALP